MSISCLNNGKIGFKSISIVTIQNSQNIGKPPALDCSPNVSTNKKLQTKKRKWKNLNLNRMLKLKRLEQEIRIATSNDLANYEAEVFQTRQFSNVQKYLASIQKYPRVPPIVYLGNKRGEFDRKKADLFNLFFKIVFNEKNTTELNPQHWILNSIEVTDVESEKILENLKLYKTTGPDKLGYIILKQCSKSIRKSLKLVLQTVLNKGVYPKYWKISQISPIFKEGN